MIRSLFAVLLMTASLLASITPDPSKAPIVSVEVLSETAVIATHADATLTLHELSDAGIDLVAWTWTDQPQEEPSLDTTWKCADGTTQHVHTPFPNIANPTPQQIGATVAKHLAIVNALKAVFPPVPNP